MTWFCEYSLEQGCFHVAPAEDCVKANCDMLSRGDKPSFVPIALFESREDAVAFCQFLHKKSHFIEDRTAKLDMPDWLKLYRSYQPPNSSNYRKGETTDVLRGASHPAEKA